MPPLWAKHLVQIFERKNCKKKSKTGGSPEKHDYDCSWHSADPAKPTDQHEMNKERGCEGKANLSRVLLQRQKCRPKQGRQRPSGICRARTRETRLAP
jgi:hypothetical protein